MAVWCKIRTSHASYVGFPPASVSSRSINVVGRPSLTFVVGVTAGIV